METAWFALIALMFAVYAVLDGFDFGAGILHLFVARSDDERRTIFAAIGPVWDGNEVWLIAGGGTLVFAFPRVYATGFSGFYLPLMMVLWLLILRGLSIEFRSQQVNPLWRALWDTIFASASTLLAVVLGAALGNVIRGVPIEREGYFHAPLFTDFHARGHAGVLDWYTIAVGAFAALALAAHGGLYLAWKTGGPVHTRSAQLANRLWLAVTISLAVITGCTWLVQPDLFSRLIVRPWAWPFPLLASGGLVTVFVSVRAQRWLRAFLGSSLFLAALLAATAAGIFPHILRSTLNEQWSLTAYNAASGRHGLTMGLLWWLPALAIVVGYFAFLFRSFRGKVSLEEGGH